MKASSPINPIPELNYDVFSKIAMQLPAVSNTKPWRDVSSFATTCKLYHGWKNDIKRAAIKKHWSAFPKGASWQNMLSQVISSSDDRENSKIFLQPTLKLLARKARDNKQLEKRGIPSDAFWLRLFDSCESLRARDVIYFLEHFSEKNSEDDYSKLVSLLNCLDKLDGENWRIAFFKIVDKIINLKSALTKDQKKDLLGSADLILQT